MNLQLDGNFMLIEAGNRHFLIVQALVNKTIYVLPLLIFAL
jgi:hypothetical protein